MCNCKCSKVGYVYRLYTTHNQCIVTLLSRHVSALLGHHHVTKAYNYDIKAIPSTIHSELCEYTRRMYYHNIKKPQESLNHIS
jgi:hypothetical protein